MTYDQSRGILETGDQFYNAPPVLFKTGGEIFWGNVLTAPERDKVSYECQSIVGTSGLSFGYQCIGVLAVIPTYTYFIAESRRIYNSVVKIVVVQQTSELVHAVYYLAPGLGFIQIDYYHPDWSFKGSWYLSNVVMN